jgi:hypothetical protein
LGDFSVSNSIQINFTWTGVFKLGLGIIAEAAMLALIEDAPESVKAATLVCSVLALGALQFEQQLRNVNAKNLFRNVLIVLAVIYSGFVIYALVQIYQRDATHRHLVEKYVEAGLLIDRKISTHGVASNPQFDEDAIKQFHDDAVAWEDSTQKWLLTNFGPAARERFLDMSSVQTICWSQETQGCDARYDITRNRLNAEKRNLSAIMETAAYGQ